MMGRQMSAEPLFHVDDYLLTLKCNQRKVRC